MLVQKLALLCAHGTDKPRALIALNQSEVTKDIFQTRGEDFRLGAELTR